MLMKHHKWQLNVGVPLQFTEKRQCRNKRFHDELATDEVASSAKEQSKRDVYFTALDVINTQLEERFEQSRHILSAFKCLYPDNFLNRTEEDNESLLKILLQQYGSSWSGDLNTDNCSKRSLKKIKASRSALRNALHS